MTFTDYADYDGFGLAALAAKGEVSPAELVEAAIERIERHTGRSTPRSTRPVTRHARPPPQTCKHRRFRNCSDGAG